MNKSTFLPKNVVNYILKKLQSAETEVIELETEVKSVIDGALKHPETTLLTSISAKKYVIVNEELHLTITINQNSAMIRITNTVHNTAEKYRVAFVDEIVAKIIKEYDSRMENVFEDVDNTILNLIKSTNLMIKVSNNDIQEKANFEVKEIINDFNDSHIQEESLSNYNRIN